VQWLVMQCIYCTTALVDDTHGVQAQIGRCPFMKHSTRTESGRQDALNVAVAAQAVVHGIVFTYSAAATVGGH